MTRAKPVPETVKVHVPFRLVKRGGRKEMVMPERDISPSNKDLVEALAQAFRWRRMLDDGEITTLSDIALHERLALSWVSRMLRLTMLSPKLIEAILDGTFGELFSVSKLTANLPADWNVQEEMFGIAACRVKESV